MIFDGYFFTFQHVEDELGIIVGFGTKKANSVTALKRYLGVKEYEIVCVNQVHGKDIYFADESGNSIFKNDADAIATDKSGLILCIFTADCLPVALLNKKDGIVAMIHCGWRGLRSGIIQNVIKSICERWRTDVKNFRAYLGPSIRGCCYCVGDDVYEQFPEGFARDISFKRNNNKWFFNIASYTESILRACDIMDIYDIGLCTICRSDLFNSRRFYGSGVLPQINFVLRIR